MICMFYLTGEVIDDKITTQCNGEDRYMSNLIKQIIASILESLKDQGTNNSELAWSIPERSEQYCKRSA